MYVCMYVSMYVCVCECVCACVYMYVCVCECVCVSVCVRYLAHFDVLQYVVGVPLALEEKRLEIGLELSQSLHLLLVLFHLRLHLLHIPQHTQ